jgi:hypothetical protein
MKERRKFGRDDDHKRREGASQAQPHRPRSGGVQDETPSNCQIG